MSIVIEDEAFDGEEDVAEEQGLSIRTLARWRVMGEGPPWIKRGRRVFYRRKSRKEWFAGQERGGVR